MLTYKTFGVETERRVETSRLCWPKAGEANHDSGLGCNRLYSDLRGLPWREARRVYEVETRVIEQLEASDDPQEELEQIEYDRCYGLDIGVASTVVGLSASRCLPFASCNAGSFGGIHHEEHPLVAFYSRPQSVRLLLESAEDAGAGLINNDFGALTVYGDDIRKIRAFALALMGRSVDFRALRLSLRGRQRRAKRQLGELQLKLL